MWFFLSGGESLQSSRRRNSFGGGGVMYLHLRFFYFIVSVADEPILVDFIVI